MLAVFGHLFYSYFKLLNLLLLFSVSITVFLFLQCLKNLSTPLLDPVVLEYVVLTLVLVVSFDFSPPLAMLSPSILERIFFFSDLFFELKNLIFAYVTYDLISWSANSLNLSLLGMV